MGLFFNPGNKNFSECRSLGFAQMKKWYDGYNLIGVTYDSNDPAKTHRCVIEEYE